MRVKLGQSRRVLDIRKDEDKGSLCSARSASQFIERGMFTRSLNQTAVAQSPSSGLLREIYEDTKRGRKRERRKSGTAGSRRQNYCPVSQKAFGKVVCTPSAGTRNPSKSFLGHKVQPQVRFILFRRPLTKPVFREELVGMTVVVDNDQTNENG